MFKLMNYTTEVPAERSIAAIKKLLVEFGANAMMEEYLSDGRIFSIAFKLGTRSYKLPVNYDGIKKVLYANKRQSYRVDSDKKRDEHCYRISWRILHDWIHSQLSLVASGQAAADQVLLPYMFDGKRTLYEAYKQGGLKIEDKRGDERSEPTVYSNA
jgi:hypothetical protein